MERDKSQAQILYKNALSGFLDIQNPNNSVYYKIGKMYAEGLGTTQDKMYLSPDKEKIEYNFDVDTLLKNLVELSKTDDIDLSLKYKL